jgi:hypothetical protein
MSFKNIHMKEKLMKFILAGILFAPMISMVPIWAANYSVGVKVGDWIKYDISGTVPQLEQYDWVRMEVQGLNGTVINVLVSIHYDDGSDENNTLSWDIETNIQPWIIPAGLNKGDTIPLVFATWIINNTVTRTYAGASRSVNLLILSEYDVDTEMGAYWDQATGFLVELSLSKSSPTESWNGGYKVMETNMWSPVLQATSELSSDTAIQGETVTVSAVVRDKAENLIEEATVSAKIDNSNISLSDLGGGNYEGILKTVDLPTGTYSIIISVEKAGYESDQVSQNLTIKAAPPETPWMLYGGIAAAIIIVAVVVFYLAKKKL